MKPNLTRNPKWNFCVSGVRPFRPQQRGMDGRLGNVSWLEESQVAAPEDGRTPGWPRPPRPRRQLRSLGLTLLSAVAGALLLLSCKMPRHSATVLPAFLLHPDAPEMNRRAPELFHVRLETSRGLMVIEVHRDWSPHGADHFYNLVRAGYYDEARFFRVMQGRWAQAGINGDPKISNVWRERTIPDDSRRESNVRGTIAYAFAVPNGRTTQVFINLRDNSATHDPEPFVPFGKIVEGMEVADALNAEYGESAGGGIRGGKQGPLFEMGNAWFEHNFPRLDYITRATVIAPIVRKGPAKSSALGMSTFSLATQYSFKPTSPKIVDNKST